MEVKMVSVIDIPFDLDTSPLLELLGNKPDSVRAKELEYFAQGVIKTSKPRALYKVCFIEAKGEDTINLDSVTFMSRTLRNNLDKIDRVFPFIITCGAEIDAVEAGEGDLEMEKWITYLKSTLIVLSMKFLLEHLAKEHSVSELAGMCPGQGGPSDWPLEQLKELFSIFGDVEELIGVRLTESHSMIPEASVAGIFLPTEANSQGHAENPTLLRIPSDKEVWESIRVKSGITTHPKESQGASSLSLGSPSGDFAEQQKFLRGSNTVFREGVGVGVCWSSF